jgi:hypothetical protein
MPGSSIYSRQDVQFLTLFRPASGELRAEPVEQSTNAILHPWLMGELTAILKSCLPGKLGETREVFKGLAQFRWKTSTV